LADKKEIKQEITIGSANEQKWQLDPTAYYKSFKGR
jgi:hypothetical protein